LPDWYLEEPMLIPGTDFYMKAFEDLKTERSIGMGMGLIPWRAMIQYAVHVGLDGANTDNFVIIIKAMDHAYLNWHQKESEKKHNHRERDTKTKGAT
jgi:hypothetical protein